jgi:hypothetical protein
LQRFGFLKLIFLIENMSRSFDVPEGFVPFSREFAKRVIEYAPDDIIDFARGYFTAMCDGELDAFLVEQRANSRNFRFDDMPADNFQQERGQALADIFNAFDTKQQGTVSLGEFVQIGKIFDPTLTAALVQERFQLPSADNDLNLSADDFIGFAAEMFFPEGDPAAVGQFTGIVMAGVEYLRKTAHTSIDSGFPDQPEWDVFTLAHAGSLAGVKRLVEAKADLEQVDGGGNTVLSIVAARGHLQLTQFLVASGAIVSDNIIGKALTNNIAAFLSRGSDVKRAHDDNIVRRGLIIMDPQQSYTIAPEPTEVSMQVQDSDGLVLALNELRGRARWSFVAITKDEHPANHVSFASSHGPDVPVFSEALHPVLQTPIFVWPDHCVVDTPGKIFFNSQ